jgi:hypothetical protein
MQQITAEFKTVIFHNLLDKLLDGKGKDLILELIDMIHEKTKTLSKWNNRFTIMSTPPKEGVKKWVFNANKDSFIECNTKGKDIILFSPDTTTLNKATLYLYFNMYYSEPYKLLRKNQHLLPMVERYLSLIFNSPITLDINSYTNEEFNGMVAVIEIDFNDMTYKDD